MDIRIAKTFTQKTIKITLYETNVYEISIEEQEKE